MEYSLSEALIKSLERSLPATIKENASNFSFIAAYLLALALSDTRRLRLSFFCLVSCIFVYSSIIYDYLDGYHLHLGYSIIYLFCVKYIKELKAIIALCIMAWFNLLMSWDAYHYATTETWLYDNYVSITTCCHVVIIVVCIDWGGVIKRVNDCVSNLRIMWVSNCHFLYL